MKNKYLKTFAFATAWVIFNPAFGACDNTGNPIKITSSCEDLSINNTVTGVSVASGATVSAFFSTDAVNIGTSGNVTDTFLNLGTISNGIYWNGLVNSGVINTLQNQGTITSGGHNGLTNSGNITTLNNTGTINSDASGSAYGALVNSGQISTLNNSGTISATVGTLGNGAYAIQQNGRIGTLNNSGTISAQNNAIYFQPAFSARIDTLINSGTIQGGVNGSGSSTFASAIVLGVANSIGTITNTGTIDHSICSGGTCYAAIENNGGSIGTINNLGNLTSGNTGSNGYGIINGTTGTIGTLNNGQNNLTYRGTLPTNYNIIISSSSNYGKTTFSNVSGSPMTFGIGAGSAISRSNTYADVLSGVTASNLVNTSGSLGGGVVLTQWNLTNTSGTNWSFTTTPSTPVAPTVTYSYAGTKLAAALTTAYTYAAAGGLNPVLSNGVTLGSAVQDLTTSQVNQLINVHAEGYSSNMTIGLEQMAHITNTVMDRIHAPMSASPSTKVYQDDEGRYIWADAAAVNGTVNNYNNLAGFGYNLYDLIIGGDIKRSKEGGYGVFAGTGSTSMTESQQVTQNFNTTNFYAGLYGARNFDAQVKLSGALGYMYGNTSANRNTPNVGLFTGGNATSTYKTNGMYAAGKLAKAFQADSFTVSPFVGASYSQLWMGGASEQGGNDFNFAISSATAYTAVTFAGLDFVYPLLKGTNDPLSLIGFYKLGYDWYANSNSAHSITATSPTYGSFTQVGANMGPVSNMVGLGIQGGITKEVSARIGAVASYNTYGHEHGGGAELRFKF